MNGKRIMDKLKTILQHNDNFFAQPALTIGNQIMMRKGIVIMENLQINF
jgi:hypothetical protein